MSPALIAGSLFAIMGLAALAHWLFPVKKRLNADRIARHFKCVYPDEALIDMVIDGKGNTALLRLTRSDAVGLVLLHGDRVVCRLVEGGDMTIRRPSTDHLTLLFEDVTLPRMHMALMAQDIDTAQAWLAPLGFEDEAAHAH